VIPSTDRLVDVIERELGRGVVGVAVGLIADGTLVWSEGFGARDLERPDPVTPRTVFRIQSVSKAVVATALMRWVERGAFALDDPVNLHLAPIRIVNEWEQQTPVTIRQLLTHTAGIPMTPGAPPTVSLEHRVAHEVHTAREPGTGIVYANLGYDVLGYLLERIAETPWQRAVSAAVLEPLGMAATKGDRGTGEPGAETAIGHLVSQLDGAQLRLDPTPLGVEPAPSGGLVSNVDDLASFLLAHLDATGDILTPDTISDMHRLHARSGDGPAGMGLGYRVDERGGRRFFCHAGDGSGYTTFIGGHPTEQVGVVLLMNTGGAQEARSTIVRAALDTLLAEVPPRTRTGGAPVRPGPGGYCSTYWDVKTSIADTDGDPVLTTIPDNIAFAGSTARLTPVGDRWRAEGGLFDGCELDFAGSFDGRRFSGGLYPLEFVANDEPAIVDPVDVDEHGDLHGAWVGSMQTPLGSIALELSVAPVTDAVAITVLGATGTDHAAEARRGRVRARVSLDVVGFGILTAFTRLGLVESRLLGLIYVRTGAAEFVLPIELERD
jgi:CubicO group peptidase (beta-lactamase class C family)